MNANLSSAGFILKGSVSTLNRLRLAKGVKYKNFPSALMVKPKVQQKVKVVKRLVYFHIDRFDSLISPSIPPPAIFS